MLSRLKRLLTGTFPDAARTYRELRSRRLCGPDHLMPTMHGFRLAGNPIMTSADFEPMETRFVRERIRTMRVFVDIGANIGFYTCLARQAGARVIAVEPSRENLDCLLFNLGVNGWDDVEVLPLGLSERIGTAALHGAGTGASLLSGWAGEPRGGARLVPLSTLDTIIGERFAGESVLVKIDVEGAELSVLRGAARMLARRPSSVWLVEVCLTEHHPDGLNPDFARVFETFWAEGYEARALLENGNERLVTAKNVTRWVTERKREFGHVSYVFERPRA